MFPLYVKNEFVNNILGVFRPIYVISRIFGFFPFSITMDQTFLRNETFMSKIDLMLFTLHLSLYSSFAVFNVSTNAHKYVKISPVLETGNRSVLTCGILSCICVLIGDLYNRKRVWKIFQLLELFDSEIRMVPITLNYNLQRKYFRKHLILWGLLTVICVIYSALIYVNYYPLLSFAPLVSSYMLANGVYTVILTIYSFLLYNIRDRFKILNQNLIHLLSPSEMVLDIKIISISDKEINCLLKKIANLHDMLIDILVTVNHRYSFQVMLCIGACFTFTVFTLYGLYNLWFVVDIYSDPQLITATIQVVWAFYYYYFVMRVLSAGNSVCNEGKYTGVIIHKHINDFNQMLTERMMIFSQQLMHRIPEATCKLFVFDWTIMFSLISSTVTYIIILIQFDSSNSPMKLDIYNATR